MLLVLKIGSRFFTFLSSPQPTLHSLACSLLFQFLDHLWREASWSSFAVRQTCFFTRTSALSLLPECSSSFLTSSHHLMHVILAPFSALVPGSLVLQYKIFSFRPRYLIYFACLELVFYESSQAKLPASIAPCGVQAVNVHIQCAVSATDVSTLLLHCSSHC